ncbi:hypothetical protein TNCT_672921 [Trichonephila clavata]|uniref:Uncharacterized protein n=1 Tax=Trichonephila clavata TaxID=2740835 RepID=A0A8X6KW34_TRICU|nr:hypothetical protein TNCT_672921 [Trichonephila clavata]
MVSFIGKSHELLWSPFKVDPCAVPYDGNSRDLSYHITARNLDTASKDKKEAFEFGIHPEDAVSFQAVRHSYSSPPPNMTISLTISLRPVGGHPTAIRA